MIRIRVFVVLIAVSLLAPLALAQDEKPARSLSTQKVSAVSAVPAIRTFRVKPSNRPVAIMAPNARVPAPPSPIDPSTMKKILLGIGGSGEIPSAGSYQAAPDPVLDHIVLTAKNPWYNERGYLRLTLPYGFHPESSIEFNKNFPNILDVKLNVENGGLYLVDFSVKAIGAGTYNVETESGNQAFEDSKGSMEHVLIALSAGASGWTSLQMKREGTGYQLYSVEVTKAN